MDNEYFAFLIFVVDLLIVSFYLSMAVYCFNKLSVELFDFQSFLNPNLSTQGLIFAWLFSSSLTVYAFLNSMEIPAEQLILNFRQHFSNYSRIEWATQQLIIPILGSLVLFGVTIFPKIPFAIGGGQPRSIEIVTIDKNIESQDEKLFLIGENEQYFFIIAAAHNGKDGRALEINKESVFSLETRTSY